ncbi:MAG: VOC family protein, partial [Vallitaleaceae bacterium]|nr:VOC family protein [Vallitaleaceae bacterium]
VEFYHSIIGGKLDIMLYSEMPGSEGVEISESSKGRVMHSAIVFEDGNSIYFSDAWEEALVQIGNNSTIHLVVDNEKDVYDFVEKLSVGGEITMPADRTFWNSVYGSCVDQFGVCWGIEFEIK